MTSKTTQGSAFSPGAQQGMSPGANHGMAATASTSQNGGEQLSERASDLAGQAAQVASDASERLNITMEDQKRAGAQRISQFAQAVQTAASQLDRDTPEFARYIRSAADQVQGFSEKLRTQNMGELFSEFQGFAKRHPTAFLGVTVLTGFALARFIKSGTAAQGSTNTGWSGRGGSERNTGTANVPSREPGGQS